MSQRRTFVLELTDEERRLLILTLNVGMHAVAAASARDGGRTPNDPRPARKLLDLLEREPVRSPVRSLVGPEAGELVTVAEGSVRTGVPSPTVSRWARLGRVRSEKRGKDWFVDVAEVAAHDAKRKAHT